MKFRKKPVVVDTIQYNGSNGADILEWTNQFDMKNVKSFPYLVVPTKELFIHTLEGEMHASAGDWIIRGPIGEFYPCKPDVFEMTYEKVE